jgi:hypothetical protein
MAKQRDPRNGNQVASSVLVTATAAGTLHWAPAPCAVDMGPSFGRADGHPPVPAASGSRRRKRHRRSARRYTVLLCGTLDLLIFHVNRWSLKGLAQGLIRKWTMTKQVAGLSGVTVRRRVRG